MCPDAVQQQQGSPSSLTVRVWAACSSSYSVSASQWRVRQRTALMQGFIGKEPAMLPY